MLAANAAYAGSFDLAGLGGNPTRKLAVVTCMDARIDPLRVLGLDPGQAVIIRNAGGRVDDGVIGELIVARHLLGVDRVAVIAHTNCRMIAASADEIRDRIREAGGPDTRAIDFPTTPHPEIGVRADLERVRSSEFLPDLEAAGFVYDVETGRLSAVA